MNSSKETQNAESKQQRPKLCGIIRPISAMGDYSKIHWEEVAQIIDVTAREVGFETKLVSDENEIGIIQKRIIQNLYDCPLIICDVSGKNPNVMFELGMRLAFDKPTIIIKDDLTDYSFDISVIEHLTYPSSLHFQTVLRFQKILQAKIKATSEEAEQNSEYSPFLKNFGELVPAKIAKKEISEREYTQRSIDRLDDKVDFLISRIIYTERPLGFFQAEEVRDIKNPLSKLKKISCLNIMERLKEAREKRKFVNSARQVAEVEREIELLERHLAELDID